MLPVHISPKHRMIGVPYQDAVHNLFPNAREFPVAGEPHLLLPHGPTETFLLRKLGFDVPPPILTQYDWAGGTPFDVQKKTCAMLSLNPRAYVLNGLGTGKTRCPLWTWDYLRWNNLIGKMLVLAPLSTLTFTWQREVFAVLPHRKAVVLHGDKKRRLQRLADPDAEIFVINHDGINVILDELKQCKDIDALVIDELAEYRNNSARTKTLKKFANEQMKWVWGMSGSPIPKSPTDAWAQCSIVTPHTVPRYFTRFRDDLMTKVNNFKWVPKDDAVERAFAAMQPAVRFTIDDVVELPECIERTIDVELGPKQGTIYKQLVASARAAIANHEITGANAGAVMSKLLQVSTGWVYASDGNVVPLDNDKRIQALMDCIKGTDRKVLVFVPFKHALAGISSALTTAQTDHATVSGDTSAGKRSEIFNLFQNTDRYKVIAAHPECLAHGITLTAADTIVWFGPVTSLDIYDQANHRIKRVGQKHKQQIIHLQSTPVERKVYGMLRNRQRVQERFLELFKKATSEEEN